MPLLTTEDRLGKTIGGKYRLDRVLGEGGMGVVYAGHHLKLDLPVAVKFLHPQYSRTPEIIERFLREARATSRLVHPNVVGVRDVDVAEEDGSAYMVLEFLEGRSLATHLEHEKVLSVDETLSILLPVCDALAAAHDLGIVHRDIKPDNVFLSRGPDGRITPKVLDFGIAKLTAHGSGPSATATGAVMGTALYMAPEQAMGRTKEVGAVSDVWSTAVMTYECLTGAFPFDVELGSEMSAMAVMMASITAAIVPLSDRRGELSAMSAVLARALDRDTSTRTASMRAFADDLRAAAANIDPAVRVARMPAVSPVLSPSAGAGPGDRVASLASPRTGVDSLARTALPDSLSDEAAARRPARPRGVYLVLGSALVLSVLGGGAVLSFRGSPDRPPMRPVAGAPVPTLTETRSVGPEAAATPTTGPSTGVAETAQPTGADVAASREANPAARPAEAGVPELAVEGPSAPPRGVPREPRAARSAARLTAPRATESTGEGGAPAPERAEAPRTRDADHRAGSLTAGEF
jgi:serine/threonine protein kinase